MSVRDSWPEVCLGDVIEEVTVGHVGSMASEYRADGVPFLRSQNVRPFRLDIDDVKFIDERFHARLSKSKLRDLDVVTVRTGKPGATAVVPPGFGPANCSDLVITRSGPLVDPYWLAYYINSIADSSIATLLVGAVQQHFNVGAMRSLKVKLPPRGQQRAIAAVLSALDDKIAANTKLATTAESLLRLEFRRLGIDREPAPDKAIILGDLFHLNPARPKPSDENPIYVDMARLPTAGFAVSRWTRRPYSGGVRFKNGDTVMARITPCLENGKVGYADFLDSDHIGIGSTEYIVIRSREDLGVPLQLSYFLARSPRFHSNAIQQMVGTSGRQRVAAKDLDGFRLTAPDAGELARFGELAGPLFRRVRAATDESNRLAATRDALLPALMSGRLTVGGARVAVENAIDGAAGPDLLETGTLW